MERSLLMAHDGPPPAMPANVSEMAHPEHPFEEQFAGTGRWDAGNRGAWCS